MAGVGFKLNKIFEKKTMTARTLGVLSSPLPVIGPCFFFLIVLFCVNGLMRIWQVSEEETYFFAMTFIGLSLLAIMISAFVGAALSRYVSDKIFEEREADISASMYGVMLLGSGVAAVGAGFMSFFIREQLNVKNLFLVFYFVTAVLLVNLFHLSIYMSVIRQYGKMIVAYTSGLTVFLIAVYLCHLASVGDLVSVIYLSMACGLLIIDFVLVCLGLKAFGKPGKNRFGFVKYMVKHSYLVWSGVALFVGLFITIIPQHDDMTVFSVILLHLPGMAVFEIIMRKFFYRKYARYLSVVHDGTYAMINKERKTLQNGIRMQVLLAYGMQLTVTLIEVALVNVLSGYSGMASIFEDGFTIPAIGMFFVFCMYDTIIILYYFSGYKEAGIITTVFALAVILGMFGFYQLGEEYSSLALPVGGFVGWMVSVMILRSRLKNINAFLLCK